MRELGHDTIKGAFALTDCFADLPGPRLLLLGYAQILFMGIFAIRPGLLLRLDG
jgi:hypothetical protein